MRPQLVPAIAVAVIAVGGIRLRSHYPGPLGGLALPIVLSGLLDWVTWGWPFHCHCYVCLLRGQGLVRGRPEPVLLTRLGMGFLEPLWSRHCALRAVWRGEAAAAVLGGRHSSSLSTPPSVTRNMYISPALPLIVTLPASARRWRPNWLADRLANLRFGVRCWSPCRWVGPSPPRSGGVAEPYMVLDSIPRIDPCDASRRCGQGSLRGGDLPRQYVVAHCGLLRFAPRHHTLHRGRYSESHRAERL